MKLLYFAWVRQKVGRSEEDLALPSDVTTVASLVDFLRRRGAGYEAAFARPELLRLGGTASATASRGISSIITISTTR